MPKVVHVSLFTLTLAVFLSITAGFAHADTIRSNFSGTSTSGLGYWGQSVMTGSEGPWNNLAFNFYSPTAGPHAFGNIFLLDDKYLGAPISLSASTSGYIAQAAAVGGAYVFDPTVTIAANTQYFFYTDTMGVLVGDNWSGVPGEGYYFAGTNYPNFIGPDTGVNFLLESSSVAAVPEPSTFVLLTLGLAGLVFARTRGKINTAGAKTPRNR